MAWLYYKNKKRKVLNYIDRKDDQVLINPTLYVEGDKAGYVYRVSALRHPKVKETKTMKKHNDNVIKALSIYKQENKHFDNKKYQNGDKKKKTISKNDDSYKQGLLYAENQVNKLTDSQKLQLYKNNRSKAFESKKNEFHLGVYNYLDRYFRFDKQEADKLKTLKRT